MSSKNLSVLDLISTYHFMRSGHWTAADHIAYGSYRLAYGRESLSVVGTYQKFSGHREKIMKQLCQNVWSILFEIYWRNPGLSHLNQIGLKIVSTLRKISTVQGKCCVFSWFSSGIALGRSQTLVMRTCHVWKCRAISFRFSFHLLRRQTETTWGL